MKKEFVIEKKELLSQLASMQPLCAKRTTVDATSYILFEVGHKELVLKSSDLEVSLQSNCMMKESDFIDSETFLVNGRRIFDVVRELDGDIICRITDSKLSLTAGGVDLTLNIKEASEFPPFPERIENLMHFNSQELLKMLECVAFIIPQNNSNPALNGLYFEILDDSIRMTATDGHCLAQVSSEKYKLSEPKSWLLPRRAIFELKKLIENNDDSTIFLGICENQLVFSGESFNFFTRLLADPFPEYRKILEKDSFVPAIIDRVQFIKTLRRSTCLLSGQFLATRFLFEPDKLKVSIKNKEVGSLDEELVLKDFSSESMDIRFYTPYLLSGLQTFNENDLKFFLQSSTKPIIFESENENLKRTYLVMPVSPTVEH